MFLTTRMQLSVIVGCSTMCIIEKIVKPFVIRSHCWKFPLTELKYSMFCKLSCVSFCVASMINGLCDSGLWGLKKLWRSFRMRLATWRRPMLCWKTWRKIWLYVSIRHYLLLPFCLSDPAHLHCGTSEGITTIVLLNEIMIWWDMMCSPFCSEECVISVWSSSSHRRTGKCTAWHSHLTKSRIGEGNILDSVCFLALKVPQC